jgi:two-component system response regulator HydG
VTLLGNPLEALQHLETAHTDVAVIDIRMPQMDGMELLSRIKAQFAEVEVVMMTGFGGVQDAVEAIKRGAYDFLSKPFESMEAAELTVRRAAELRRLERRVRELEMERLSGKINRPIIGQSAAIKHVIDLIESVAGSPSNVLIVGENGTGKELVARAIHENSRRAHRPLVTLNCSAVTESLMESELFGHLKGAFTGATSKHGGLFLEADGGTLFLDEIGDMPLATQPRLLRAIQEGEIRPVGSSKSVQIDVRLIAATNQDLALKSAAGTFRQDLYYRLNVVRIELPPLRGRPEDIPLLAHHFLVKHQRALEKTFDGFEPEALRWMARYAWPGNVRQLENAIERAVVVARGKTLRVADLPSELVGSSRPSVELELSTTAFAEAKSQAIARFERHYLIQAIERHGSVSAAARAAGLDRSNFRRLLKRHDVSA